TTAGTDLAAAGTDLGAGGAGGGGGVAAGGGGRLGGEYSGLLTFDHATRSWTSDEGLVYGEGSAHGNRVKHVLEHLTPNAAKPAHTVFNVKRGELFALLDEAWLRKPATYSIHARSGNWNYVVPMGRAVGTNGETSIILSMRPGTST